MRGQHSRDRTPNGGPRSITPLTNRPPAIGIYAFGYSRTRPSSLIQPRIRPVRLGRLSGTRTLWATSRIYRSFIGICGVYNQIPYKRCRSLCLRWCLTRDTQTPLPTRAAVPKIERSRGRPRSAILAPMSTGINPPNRLRLRTWRTPWRPYRCG